MVIETCLQVKPKAKQSESVCIQTKIADIQFRSI